eukprot:TRINITY_DN4520_c0_g1_i6.p1 TRINITY_DN4520_c0_g1~~TRINITY_DN4520_c0_g1_i6.p1  ORF type:complete len:329 (+),score=77.29 TRINITY_DN4520_c0_g1_i6:124-987(+)
MNKPGGLGAPVKTTVFATPLSDVIAREHDELTTPIAFARPIPYLVEECIAYLYPEQQLVSEGIFRQSGKAVDIQDVKSFYDKGKYVSLQGFADPHVVSGIIKLFIRELPDPLIPFSVYPQFIAYQKSCQNEKDPVGKLSNLISLLPKDNRALLKLLLLLLKRTATFEKKNKMSPANLAIVIGPNILHAKEETMLSAMEESPLINFITTSLIELTPEIWENDKETQHLNLEWLLEKRAASLPVLIPISAARESVEVQKQAKSKLAAWFQRRPKKEELVQKKILQSFDY